MDTLSLADFQTDSPIHPDADVVSDEFPFRAFSRAQRDLLELIPIPGAAIALDEALLVVGNDHAHPYGQIIVLMNRGVIDAEYDGDVIDPEIILRRL
ncbi:hypothetical protein [Aureimonas phyllosphaerae]|uniref:Uncharacterized protein n=1 Tax=Aureimonas phyllosphaerae TaxID=1166078 RepID=A0A7W6BVS2_9HYPH|nr:hypothetical protein [Aureimonas phyllosphaerae]MBB3937220.1 hypothetical protein [Aureimonas phyllosphaerae]MBB3961143.1 hypothetical protein [Aureimonas phyllosphaerae]SFF49110.1 hypothetical protein SAMN05216566_11748 [Aureimonas phyllosphaerae]